MVGWKALKLVIIMMVGMAAFVLAGAAMRFASRILSFAFLAFMIVVAGYAVYELVSGWTAAEADDRTARRTDGSDSADELREQYVDAELSESEFEQELEAIMGNESVNEEDESSVELNKEL